MKLTKEQVIVRRVGLFCGGILGLLAFGLSQMLGSHPQGSTISVWGQDVSHWPTFLVAQQWYIALVANPALLMLAAWIVLPRLVPYLATPSQFHRPGTHYYRPNGEYVRATWLNDIVKPSLRLTGLLYVCVFLMGVAFSGNNNSLVENLGTAPLIATVCIGIVAGALCASAALVLLAFGCIKVVSFYVDRYGPACKAQLLSLPPVVLLLRWLRADDYVQTTTP